MSSTADPRETLMRAILPHIAFDGWIQGAMARGASDAGMAASDLPRYFPSGPAGLFEYFSRWADAGLAAGPAAETTGEGRVHERVRDSVRRRIEIMSPWREAVRRGVAFAALPSHAGLGIRCLYRTVDEIWHVAGDRSADFSFYTRRASLAGIYGATFLYWLDDRSDGYSASWEFLDRRIADIGRIRAGRERLSRFAKNLPDPRRFAPTGR